MLGCTFSNAADKFPFLDMSLLRQYPYAMPYVISAAVPAAGATLAYFLLVDQLPHTRAFSCLGVYDDRCRSHLLERSGLGFGFSVRRANSPPDVYSHNYSSSRQFVG